MPLTSPIKRDLTHTRVVTCTGYHRADGLFDIEGHLLDTKPFDFANKDRGGTIKAGEALHGMHVRITIDMEMIIQDAEAIIDDAPYNYCKSVAGVFKQLVGVKIGPGWRKQVRSIMGGTKGCTHLTELLNPMATTAYQSMVSERIKQREQQPASEQRKISPALINSCHSHAVDSPVMQEHWPGSYQPSE